MRYFISIIKFLSVALFGTAIAVVGFFVHQKCFNGNVYTVEEHILYRSAQPDAATIKKYKDEYGIKSIISLRRKRPDKKWWIEETKESKLLGINHYDVALSSTMEAPMFRMKEMVRLMKNVPRPILVHCEGGSDRTGLAVALYFYSLKHMPADQAEHKGLNIIYGHFPYFGSGTDAMSSSFHNYVNNHD